MDLIELNNVDIQNVETPTQTGVYCGLGCDGGFGMACGLWC